MPDTTLASNARVVAEAWPGISSVSGQSKVRVIAKTGRVSEHVFGNALDIFGSRKGMSSLAAHLNQRKSQLSIRTLCYDGGPGPSYQHCTTPHLNHIHISFDPKCRGTVATSGTADERRNDCEAFQQGGAVTSPIVPGTGGQTREQFFQEVVDTPTAGSTASTGDGFLGIPGAIDRFNESIESGLQTALYVLLGVVILGAGITIAVRGTDAFKAVQGIVTKVATKGAV